jgi:hypothetical protein
MTLRMIDARAGPLPEERSADLDRKTAINARMAKVAGTGGIEIDAGCRPVPQIANIPITSGPSSLDRSMPPRAGLFGRLSCYRHTDL